MISNIIALAFVSREAAHRAHLATKSYAQHQALGSFYVEVIEAADALAEATQGRMGLLEIPYLKRSQAENIAQELRGYLDTIEKIRYEGSAADDAPIQNLVDALIEVYLSTLYKLENLS